VTYRCDEQMNRAVATEHILTASAQGSNDAHELSTPRWLAVVSDYWSLTKPEVNFLIVVCSAAGFYGSPSFQGGPHSDIPSAC
jgi:heme O synthase-like polyprenyltransferase